MNENDIVFVTTGVNGNGLGGDPNPSQIIIRNTLNNLGFKIPRLPTQQKYLRCVGVKNNHATEKIINFITWLHSTEKIPLGVTVEYGLDTSKYKYKPYMNFNGTSDFVSEPDSASLDLTTFTICVWFKTSFTYIQEGAIVNKGGFGSDTAGQNMNYGMWVDFSDQKLRLEFETSAGANNRITSPNVVNDGQWHFACGTFDGSVLKLYLDGNTTPVDSLNTSAVPETNTNPLVIGRNSRASDRFFNGQIDEVRIWNRALSAQEQNDIYLNGTTEKINTGLVYENKFGADSGEYTALTIANENTNPTGVTFLPATAIKPEDLNLYFGELKPGHIRNLWIRLTVDPLIKDVDNAKIFFGIYGVKPVGSVGGGQSTSLVTLVDFGDSDINDDTRNKTLPLAIAQNPNLIIGNGDHNYEDSGDGDDYRSTYLTILDKLRFTKGNHDTDNASKRTYFRTHHGITIQSQYWYSFNIQNIHVLVMSSEDSFSVGSAQHTFVTNDLQQAKNNGAINWIIAVYHRPWWTAKSDHPGNEGDVVEKYMQLFIQNGVNLIFVGHNHNYQRSHPLTFNSDDPDNPNTQQTGTNTYIKGAWLIQVLDGRGGHDKGSALYKIDSSPLWLKVSNRTTNGVGKLFTTNNGLTLNYQALDWDGEVIDSFSIA